MKLLRSEDGTALIETALLLPVLLIIVVGVIDYALIIEQRLRLVEAVAAGAAYAALPGHGTDTSGATNAATQASVNMPGISVTATAFWTCTAGGGHVNSNTMCSGGTSPMQWMEVDATASPTLKIQFSSLTGNIPLAATAVRRVVR